jgi:hypothetical protein
MRVLHAQNADLSAMDDGRHEVDDDMSLDVMRPLI